MRNLVCIRLTMTFRPARQPEADTVFIKHSQLKAEFLNKLS